MNATLARQENLRRLCFLSLLCLFAGQVHSATWTVTSSADAGPSSLRDTVSEAASGDNIDFTVTGVITLTSGTISIDKNLSVAGPGSDQLTIMGTMDSTNGIDGVTNGTAFSILSNSVVTISGLTIAGNTYGNGGGVNNRGTVLLQDCIVSNCSVAGFSVGGGIYNSGDMQLARCVIQDNQSGYGSLFNSGNMTLLECTVAGNEGYSASGIENEGFMTLGDCAITNNSSVDEGGGIANGILTTNCTIILTNCTIADNSSYVSPGAGLLNMGTAILGGCSVRHNEGDIGVGVWNGGFLTVSNSTIADNSDVFSGWGGGLANEGTAIIRDCSVLGNFALTAGGIDNESMLSVTNCLIADNSAWASGGAPGLGGGLLNRGTAFLVNTTVGDNAVGANVSAFALGAGIWNAGTLSLVCCTVCSNQANVPLATSLVLGVGVDNVGTAMVQNTIIAGNGNSLANGPDFLGTLSSEGFNLIGDTNGCTILGDTTGNFLGVDPLLGPLQDNGGPTRTHALLPGSPAIDQGTSAGLTTDQRGAARPYDVPGIVDANDGSDIGAYEWNPGPAAFDIAAEAIENVPLSLPMGKFLLSVSNPMNRSLALFAVSSISTNGGSVVVSNDFVTYTPATNYVGSDRFSYTIDDGWGGFSTANVVVRVLSGSAQTLNMLQPYFTPTGVLVRFAGIPGRQYSIQRAPTATGPWETIGVSAVATDGLGGFTDPDPPESSAFYRTCYP